MRIDENFVSNFLKNIMKGMVSSREKQFMKDNPDIKDKVKKVRDATAALEAALDKIK